MTGLRQVLLDAPQGTAKRVQIAKLGEFTDGRYGDFEITPENVQHWAANLEHLPGGKAVIDFDHRSERSPRDTRAAGWITAIDLDGDRVMADTEWTPDGERAVKDGVYQFFSPVYGPFKDESGTVHEDTLSSAALTNKPFLRMPTISLASDGALADALEDDPASGFYKRCLDGELGDQARALVMLDVSAAERKLAVKEGNALPDGSYPIRNTAQLHSAAILAASGHGNVAAAKKLIRRRAKELGVSLNSLPGFGSEGGSDSRRAMAELPASVVKLLDLGEGADEQKLLDTISALKQKAEAEPEAETKTLDEQAAAEGKVVLDSAQVAEMRRNSELGKQAADELARQRFERAFDNAVQNGRAVPAQREQLEHFYALDADSTLKLLDEGPQLVNVSPVGRSYTLDGDEIPAGVHPDSHKLDQKVKTKLRELGKGPEEYITVLEQVMREGAEV